MAMGVVTPEAFDKEITSFSHLIKEPEVKVIERGRGSVNEVPETLRKVIAEESIEGTPAKELSKIFGVSQSSISAYKNGATSTASYNEPDKQLADRNRIIRSIIVGKARKKLAKAIDQITDDRLMNAKLSDITSVATAMASVIDKIEPKIETTPVLIDKLLVYSPRVKEEDSYDIIDVGEL